MKDKLIKNILFGIFILTILMLILFLCRYLNIFDFILEVENKTFDIRQKIISKYKKPDKDLVILTVDDGSYEYIINEYGAWPAPRDFWAKIAKNIEDSGAKAIVFDLMFVQNFKAFGNSDTALINTVNSSNKIYVAMNFDRQNPEIRTPIELPESLSTNIEGDTKILDNAPMINYSNVRGILSGIMNGSDNIGFINATRDKDGIMRSVMPLFVYKDKYYKHLTLLSAMDVLGLDSKNLKISGNEINLGNNKIIPLNHDGSAYLNWYGEAGTYEYIPIWETDKAIRNNDKEFMENNFKNKVVYIGASATSLADLKTIPLERRFPGVETHTVFFNNIIDNNFIKRTAPAKDFALTFLVILLTGLIVIRSKSVSRAIFGGVIIILLYSAFSVAIMHFFNTWVALVLPILGSVITITASYAIKYIITSRDYEHTYKLAVTDGLTEMFNHRYFQEQMTANIELNKKNGAVFSLIMVDIDFFKKFNDKYGHQSGDAVLRQVASTIKKNIRSTDIPCRYGGEEMSVILPNTEKDTATQIAMKICQAIRVRDFELADGSWTHVSISVGVSTMPTDGATTTQGMIEYADKCLYIAKENGRNQVICDINIKPGTPPVPEGYKNPAEGL